MKLYNQISLAALATMFAFASCSYDSRFDDPTYDFQDPSFDADAALPEATTTFAKLKYLQITEDNDTIGGFIGNNKFFMHDNAGHAKYAKTFTSYFIPKDTSLIVNAVVISSDREGNTYKKIVLRDLTDNSSMDISIDVSGLSGSWPQGQRLTIDCAGLNIGLYADYPSMGLEYFNDDPKRLRWELGRIPSLIAKEHIKPVGLPDKSLLKPEEMTVGDIEAAGIAAYGKLVRIKNVKFGYYGAKGSPEPFAGTTIQYINDSPNDSIPFADEVEVGGSIVPISRALCEVETGKVISMTTSCYAKFAPKRLPAGTYDITAIVGWYRDQPAKAGGYQLAVQNFADITPSITE